jgi:hypothetical protein
LFSLILSALSPTKSSFNIVFYVQTGVGKRRYWRVKSRPNSMSVVLLRPLSMHRRPLRYQQSCTQLPLRERWQTVFLSVHTHHTPRAIRPHASPTARILFFACTLKGDDSRPFDARIAPVQHKDSATAVTLVQSKMSLSREHGAVAIAQVVHCNGPALTFNRTSTGARGNMQTVRNNCKDAAVVTPSRGGVATHNITAIRWLPQRTMTPRPQTNRSQSIRVVIRTVAAYANPQSLT